MRRQVQLVWRHIRIDSREFPQWLAASPQTDPHKGRLDALASLPASELPRGSAALWPEVSETIRRASPAKQEVKPFIRAQIKPTITSTRVTLSVSPPSLSNFDNLRL